MIALYAHPFSSYSQKALIAFYENAVPFEYRPLTPELPENYAAMAKLSPVGKFPVLEEGATVVFEATSIIEYLAIAHPGPVRLVPEDAPEANRVRMLDRVFDNYVMTPMQAIVADALRAPEHRASQVLVEARAMLDKSYAWLDAKLGQGEWAAGRCFTMADCAAAPSLFYADWAHPIPECLPRLRAYRARLLARPSVAGAVDEARPYRPLFPLGAPDRD